jgi:hypothetical protein
MQSNYRLFKLFGMLVMFLSMHVQAQHLSFATDSQESNPVRLKYSTDEGDELIGYGQLTKTFTEENGLCQLLISQTELRASNHAIGLRAAQLVVLDNEVARTLICPEVFERPIKLMSIDQIRRSKITAYIEFESVVFHSESKANAVYRLMCSTGCESRKFDLELRIYEGTNNWSISRNSTTVITNEPTNIK